MTIFALEPKKVPRVQTEFREVNTDIPAPGTREILDNLTRVESRSMHGQLPIVWRTAIGNTVTDIAGNKFLDMTSTIFVANVGHSNPRVTEAIEKSTGDHLISSYAYANEEKLAYIRRLLAFAGPGFEKAFLLSSGTEASEAVLKLMRLATGRKTKGAKIVTLKGNWHGRTMGAQMLSSNESQKSWIEYKDPSIVHANFPLPWEISETEGEAFFDDIILDFEKSGIRPDTDIAGFYLETFQGWGALFYPKSFVQAVERFCQKYDCILAFDEMQAGFGRTGENFGFMHYGVQPHLIAVGKGMGNGVPISGVIGRANILDLPDVGNMSSTHSGNPLVCSAALAVLDELDSKNLVELARTNGKAWLQELNRLKVKHRQLRFVSGKGLIAALIFSDEQCLPSAAVFASRVAERCMQKGLLVVHTGRESIKLGPPLTTPLEALLESVDVLDQSITEIEAERA